MYYYKTKSRSYNRKITIKDEMFIMIICFIVKSRKVQKWAFHFHENANI